MNAEPPERVSLGRLGERGLIRRIRTSAGAKDAALGVEVGIGDDTAVLAVPPGHKLLATTDLLIEDVHFRRTSAAPADIGWKALAVNLSDIAAMGGIPRWALVALAVPADTDVEAVDAFYAGMAEAAGPHGVTVVGGDTSASPGGWTVNVTLLGIHPGEPRLRSHARAGDAVAVTGSLGVSAAGLHTLEIGLDRARDAGLAAARLARSRGPPPARARVAEGLAGPAPGVHAMMDCSTPRHGPRAHLPGERGGRPRALERVPSRARRARRPAPLGATRGVAVSGGEDYELLLTCDPAAADQLIAGLAEATGTALTVIGRIEGAAGEIAFVDADGAPITMRGGFEHFHG